MSNNKVVEEDTPCMDTGSFIKVYLNPFYRWHIYNRKGEEAEPVTIVGSGKYNGEEKAVFAARSSERILFFSYRNCFPKLPNGSTTDSYWGCLVRTGQMVMAHVFMRFYGGGCSIFPEDRVEDLRTRVKPLFRDTPSAPFSIHQIEYATHDQGLKYARWLSPTQACKGVFAACEKYYQSGKRCPYPICCEDRNVNKAQVYQVLRRGEPVLILVPVVMGIKVLSDKYKRVLLRCLEMEHCCGVAGGYGKASVYFFGHQGSSVFYQDPHLVQSAYLSGKTEGKMRCRPGLIDVAKIDPCMFIGFYIPSEAGFEKFLVELTDMNSFVPFPLISVSEDDPRKKAAEAMNVPVTEVYSSQADRIVAVSEDGASSPPTGEDDHHSSGDNNEYITDRVAEETPGAVTATETAPPPANQLAWAAVASEEPLTYPTEDDAGATTNPLLPRPSSPSGRNDGGPREDDDHVYPIEEGTSPAHDE